MLGGRSPQYKDMYTKAMEVAKKYLFFRPLTNDSADILLSGLAHVTGETAINLRAEGQHLTCFVGGMVAIGAKIFNRPNELEIGKKLTEGCIWAYRSTPTGIMPEIFRAIPCESHSDCTWTPRVWYDSGEDDQTPIAVLEEKARKKNKVPGFLSITDKRYHLRYAYGSLVVQDISN